jgi:hypothetical protein
MCRLGSGKEANRDGKGDADHRSSSRDSDGSQAAVRSLARTNAVTRRRGLL